MSESESRSSSVLRPFALGAVMMAMVIAAGTVAYYAIVHRGPRIYVRFNRIADLDRGAPVLLDGRQIGTVDDVDRGRGRMRVELQLTDDRVKLPREITFIVAEEDQRQGKLEAHVLDPQSAPLEDGDEVDGVDSRLELAVRRGSSVANEALRQVRKGIDRALEEIDSIDWKGVGGDVERRSEELKAQLAQLADKTGKEVGRGYDTVAPMVQDLVRDLDKLGRSKEAQRLKARMDEFWQKHAQPWPSPEKREER